jgi:hypothetical protein
MKQPITILAVGRTRAEASERFLEKAEQYRTPDGGSAPFFRIVARREGDEFIVEGQI